MNWLLVVTSALLLAQVDIDPRFRPQFVPGKGADDSPKSQAVENPPAVDKAPSTIEGPGGSLDPGLDAAAAKSVPKAAPKRPAAPPPSRPGLAKVNAKPQKLRPPELLAEALSTPKEDGLEGEPLPLADALRLAGDRPMQIKATHQYWQLATAQANYHFAHRAQQQLAELIKNRPPDALARSIRAEYAARVHDAHAAVLQAQNELARLLQLPAAQAQPLAADRPHVGAYDTKFQQIFVGRLAPAELVFIDRVLPVRRKAIDLHAAAIAAAADAVEAVQEEYQSGSADIATLAAALDSLDHQRRELLSSVRRYNDAIADYALTLAPSGLSETALVPRLIRVQVASQPKPKPVSTPAQQAPGLAPGDALGTPKTFEDPQDTTEPAPADRGAERTHSVSPHERGVLRMAQFSAPAEAALGDGGLYQGIVSAAPTDRLEKLVGLLYWDRSAPGGTGTPIRLGDSLARTPASDRHETIAAYWSARQAASTYQTVADHAEQLSLLTSLALQARTQPGGPGAMLRLQAARQAALADVRERQAELMEKQFALARHVGSDVQSAWPVPSTQPRAAKLDLARLGADGLANSGPQSQRQRVDALHNSLVQQAEALVLADAHRAALMQGAEANARALDQALRAIDLQQRTTLRLLASVTEYNVAIADLVLTAVSPDASAQQLLEAMGVEQSASPGA